MRGAIPFFFFRIRKISGLENLIKLDVLDLHGNMVSLVTTVDWTTFHLISPLQIREIECLNHLSHLRVLNLAGNDLTCVSGLAGLQALAELNLRRNRVTHVVCMHGCALEIDSEAEYLSSLKWMSLLTFSVSSSVTISSRGKLVSSLKLAYAVSFLPVLVLGS